jgi:hypothetical protein
VEAWHCQISETLDPRILPEHFHRTFSRLVDVAHFESRTQKKLSEATLPGWKFPGAGLIGGHDAAKRETGARRYKKIQRSVIFLHRRFSGIQQDFLLLMYCWCHILLPYCTDVGCHCAIRVSEVYPLYLQHTEPPSTSRVIMETGPRRVLPWLSLGCLPSAYVYSLSSALSRRTRVF